MSPSVNASVNKDKSNASSLCILQQTLSASSSLSKSFTSKKYFILPSPSSITPPHPAQPINPFSWDCALAETDNGVTLPCATHSFNIAASIVAGLKLLTSLTAPSLSSSTREAWKSLIFTPDCCDKTAHSSLYLSACSYAEFITSS